MDERTAVDLLHVAEDLGWRPTGPGADASLATLEARYAAIVAAIDWFVEADRADDALRLVHAMYRDLTTQGRLMMALPSSIACRRAARRSRPPRTGAARRRLMPFLDGR